MHENKSKSFSLDVTNKPQRLAKSEFGYADN